MFVHIKLAKQTREIVDRFEKALRIHPEIQECYAIAGNVDYYLKIDADDIREYEHVRRTVLCRLPGVLSIKVNIPLRKIETYPRLDQSDFRLARERERFARHE